MHASHIFLGVGAALTFPISGQVAEAAGVGGVLWLGVGITVLKTALGLYIQAVLPWRAEAPSGGAETTRANHDGPLEPLTAAGPLATRSGSYHDALSPRVVSAELQLAADKAALAAAMARVEADEMRLADMARETAAQS